MNENDMHYLSDSLPCDPCREAVHSTGAIAFESHLKVYLCETVSLKGLVF